MTEYSSNEERKSLIKSRQADSKGGFGDLHTREIIEKRQQVEGGEITYIGHLALIQPIRRKVRDTLRHDTENNLSS